MSIFKQYVPANNLRGQVLKFLFITVSMLILSAPFVWLEIYYPYQAHSVSSFVTRNFWEFTAFRLLLIAGFFMIWPVFIRRFSQSHKWAEEKIQFWLSQKYRITAWLIVFELLVCENILFHLFV